MFVNRGQELIALENRCKSGDAEFVILYGRRRTGKTELLRRFCEGRKHIYVLADLSSEGQTGGGHCKAAAKRKQP